MSIRTRAIATALAAATLTAVGPSTAQANWDTTVYVETDKVSIALQDAQAAWSPEQARSYAKWAGRIGALMPSGTTIAVDYGSITLCDDSTETCRDLDATWDDQHLFNLFELTADVVGASGKTIARARRTNVTPLTVQVAASYNERAAQRMANKINDAQIEFNGFLELGAMTGYEFAHVVESWNGAEPLYHVVVGDFLERTDAKAASTALREQLGLKGFVRVLDQGSVEYELGC